MNNRAFSLLEVMVAVAILGLSLTVILSAQAGLYASSTHAKNESMAMGMVRCKMGEIEEELLRMGYQEEDVLKDGECCADETPAKVRCTWNIDRVELPDPLSFGEMNPAGNNASLDLSTSGNGLSSLSGGTGALGVLSSLGAGDGNALQSLGSMGSQGGIGALSSMMGEASGGVAGLAPMVMSIVYPSLKPMLEASIRKITVTVLWREGVNDRSLTVVQYVTNPMRGGLMSSDMMMMGQEPGEPMGQGLPTGSFGRSGATDGASGPGARPGIIR